MSEYHFAALRSRLEAHAIVGGLLPTVLIPAASTVARFASAVIRAAPAIGSAFTK